MRVLYSPLFKSTLFDLTQFYFERPSLERSPPPPLLKLSPHNPPPKKGENM